MRHEILLGLLVVVATVIASSLVPSVREQQVARGLILPPRANGLRDSILDGQDRRGLASEIPDVDVAFPPLGGQFILTLGTRPPQAENTMRVFLHRPDDVTGLQPDVIRMFRRPTRLLDEASDLIEPIRQLRAGERNPKRQREPW
jgi:hypothetical protein